MESIHLNNKKISVLYQVVGFLFFGALTFMSLYFYKERELMMDETYYSFRMLRSGWFVADLGRYSLIINMILPWLALKIGLSLKAILMCASAWVVLFDYGVFLFITLKLKNNGAGLALMLVSCLAYSRIFYFATPGLNEVLGILLWAFLHTEIPFTSVKQKRLATIGALLITTILIFYHPLAIFFIFFVIGVEATAFKRYCNPQLWIIALLSIILFYLKLNVFFVNSYEQAKLIPISTIIHELPGFKNWRSTIYLNDFIQHHFRSLKWLFIVCVLSTLRKGILFFLFTVLYIAGFTLIFLGSFYKGASELGAYEAYFPIYGFFTAILFICLFYSPSRKTLVMLISLPFLWVGLTKIYHAHEQFTYRVSYLSRIINTARKAGDKKCIIDSRCYPYVYADAPWAYAYETLLYSSLPGPDSSVTVFIKEPSFDSVCKVDRDKKNIFFGAYFSPFQFSSNDMPDKYSRLPSTGYRDLTTSQEDTSFHEELFSSKNVKIIPLEQSVNVYLNDYLVVLPIKIENSSGKVLPAIPRKKNPIQLSYILYDNKGNKVNYNAPTAFETDIKVETACGLVIYLPFTKGTYFVKPDIITGNENWWNVSSPLIEIVIN